MQKERRMYSRFDTSCKECVFAEYMSAKITDSQTVEDVTQLGCRLDKLNLFKKYDVEILEVYDEEKALEIYKRIKTYHSVLKTVYLFLKEKIIEQN